MTQIDKPNLDEQIRSALRIAKHIAETGGDGLEERQVEAIKALIATQVREAYRKGYNDNARDCYCDSTKLIESLIPHKHLLDDDKIHNIRPNLPKGDDK